MFAPTPAELDQRHAEELACDRRPEFPEVIDHLTDEERDDVLDRLGDEIAKLDLDDVVALLNDQQAGRKGYEDLGRKIAGMIRRATRKACEAIEEQDPERWDGLG